MEKEPCLFLSEKDASRLGISRGDRITLGTDSETIEVHGTVAENMAPGILVLPRHHRLDWQHLKTLKMKLKENQLLKTDKDA